jgi:hypothetical protein
VLTRPDRVYRIEIQGSEVLVRVAEPSVDAVLHGDEKKKGPQPLGRAPK